MPVGELLGRGGAEPPRRSRWRAIAQWRDWSIPVKLAAVTLVPIMIALALGITTIANQVGRSDSYQRIDRFVALGSSLRALTDAVQHERTLTVELLTQGNSGGSAALDAARRSVDAATGPLAPAIGRAAELDSAVTGPGREATDQLGRIARFREQVAAGELDPVQAVNGYSGITGALLKLDTTLVAGISDDAIGGTPSALHDIEVAKEEVSQTQALIGFGITWAASPRTRSTRCARRTCG